MANKLRILILGAGGFVGQHLISELAGHFGSAAEIRPTGLSARPGILPLDLTDSQAVRATVQEFRPTHICNLVGIAAPATARRDPEMAWQLHAQAPERLGRIVLEEVPDCWLFQIGSGLIYGSSASHGKPVDENTALGPMDPYGVTKAAGDLAMGALAFDGLKCLRLRPFNHTGPGQTEDFAIPAFAAQIVRIEKGLQPPVINVGNLDAIRDFLDVRDVVRAYSRLIAATGETGAETLSGKIFNVASGTGSRMRDLLDMLIDGSTSTLRVELDPDRQRASDLPAIVGDATALRKETDWTQEIPLEETMRAVLDHFRQATRTGSL